MPHSHAAIFACGGIKRHIVVASRCCFRFVSFLLPAVRVKFTSPLHCYKHAQIHSWEEALKKNKIAFNWNPMQLQFPTAANCPPRYPFRFTTRNTLSRAHKRRLSEPPKKTTTTSRLSLALTRARSLSLSVFETYYSEPWSWQGECPPNEIKRASEYRLIEWLGHSHMPVIKSLCYEYRQFLCLASNTCHEYVCMLCVQIYFNFIHILLNKWAHFIWCYSDALNSEHNHG